MILQWKRHLLLGLGLSVALGLVVALPAAASAASTLTGESLTGASASGNSPSCGTSTFSVSGTATGPYPGPFTETGTFSTDGTFDSTFTITSGTTTVTGSKTRNSLPVPGTTGCSVDFNPPHAVLGSFATRPSPSVSYTATIQTPSGNFHDEGTTSANVTITGSAATLTEGPFTSTFAPTSKDQCKNNGWKAFPQFKNQGQCVGSVQSQSQT